MRHIEFLDSEIAAVERLIAQRALSWPEIKRLVTVLGVNLRRVVHRRGREPEPVPESARPVPAQR